MCWCSSIIRSLERGFFSKCFEAAYVTKLNSRRMFDLKVYVLDEFILIFSVCQVAGLPVITEALLERKLFSQCFEAAEMTIL